MFTILTDTETRVLAALVEKAVTTPEYYPLTLNALINACNQKSNRDPVVQYDGQTVGSALDSLREKGLVRVMLGGDSRVPKYREYFAEAYELTPAESAVLCELMLRGPQTLGELRGHLERFNRHLTPEEIEATLTGLATRADGALAIRLPRQPGQKDARYAHCLAGEPQVTDVPREARTSSSDRLGALEEEVRALRQELADLREAFAAFTRQFA